MPNLKIGFFRANKSIAASIQNRLREFLEHPHPVDDSRTATLNEDTHIILRNIHRENDGDYLLDFTRLRNARNQPISDRAAHEDIITLRNGQFFAEFTVSIFDTRTHVLALHESPNGASPNMIARYWQFMCPDLEKLRFDPIIEQDAVDLMMRAGAVSRFSVSLAHMGHEGHLRELGLPRNEITDLIPFYRAPNISVTLKSEPRQDQGLFVDRVREIANALLPLPKRNLKRLALIVEDESGESFPLDLIKDRMVYREPVDPGETGEVTDAIRYRAARNCWGNHKKEIRRRYDGVDFPPRA